MLLDSGAPHQTACISTRSVPGARSSNHRVAKQLFKHLQQQQHIAGDKESVSVSGATVVSTVLTV
jgi:hypothetical protein